jgi:hypothetical protein
MTSRRTPVADVDRALLPVLREGWATTTTQSARRSGHLTRGLRYVKASMADTSHLELQRNRALRASRSTVFRSMAGPWRRLFVVDLAGYDANDADLTVDAQRRVALVPLPEPRMADGLDEATRASANAVLEGLADRAKFLRAAGELAASVHAGFLFDGGEQGPPPSDEQTRAATGFDATEIDLYCSGKSINTPGGRVDLRSLFRYPPGPDPVAIVRQKIAEMIAAEDPSRPLADDEVIAALAREEIIITWGPEETHPVARWRGLLGIPPPEARRRG